MKTSMKTSMMNMNMKMQSLWMKPKLSTLVNVITGILEISAQPK